MKAIFYIATLADAVSRAARVAPNKGAAFDQAHGLILERTEGIFIVRSTNLDVYYQEKINDVVSYDGPDEFVWRLPARVFDGILQRMPTEGEVTMFTKEGDPNHAHLQCGRKRGRLRLATDADLFPPHPGMLDASRFVDADGLGNKLKQVGWATAKDAPPLTGIHFDGEYVAATDRYTLVRLPFELEIEEPFTVPLSLLSGTLANLPGKFSLAATKSNMQLKVGEEIEIITTVFAEKFPDVSKMPTSGYPMHFFVSRENLSTMISDMLVLVKNERYPRINLDLTEDALEVSMHVPEVGTLQDVLDVTWQDYDDFHIEFTPEYLVKALEGCDATTVKIELKGRYQMLYLTDEHDYHAWVQPRGKESGS